LQYSYNMASVEAWFPSAQSEAFG